MSHLLIPKSTRTRHFVACYLVKVAYTCSYMFPSFLNEIRDVPVVCRPLDWPQYVEMNASDLTVKYAY